MRLKKYIVLLLLLTFFKVGISQVKTNFNNSVQINEKGFFKKSYTTIIDFTLPEQNIAELLQKEKKDIESSSEAKPFRLAEPVSVDLDLVKLASWDKGNDFSFFKYTIKSSGALSSSINFDDFFLPKFSEMYIYNKNGEMITGAITENENNKNKIWGSWVYQGDIVTIEIKTPTKTFNELKLHINNIAYGYKEVYKSTKVGGFGQSGACNINVICPQGNGWEPERNSVSLILSDNGSTWCSGALIMNTCNTNRPFYLTANHCFNPPGLPQQNVGAWRFTFQAFSPTCTPSQNTDGVITYNGSTLRANWAATDVCLVELNNTPANNIGVHYAGWSRSTVPATSGVGIHHPRGDVMKISNYTAPLVRADNPNLCGIVPISGLSWVVSWNNGVTEGGSSGSPLFDQNHRIVGQLGGGPSSCTANALCRSDGYGRFDNSWTGGGTNATRLSNWLDPTNTGAITTNTTNTLNLATPNASLTISGDGTVCTTSNPYFLPNLAAGSTVTWTVTPSNRVTINTPNATQTTLTKIMDGTFSLIATVTNCQGTSTVTKLLYSGAPGFGAGYSNGISSGNPVAIYFPNQGSNNIFNNVCIGYGFPNVYIDGQPYGTNNVSWSVPSGYETSAFSLYTGYGNRAYFSWNYGGTTPPGYIQGSVSNGCGSSSQIFAFKQINCGTPGGDPCAKARETNYFTISPNPASDNIKIGIANKPPPINCNKLNALSTPNGIIFSAVNVYDKLGTLVKSYKTKNVKNATIQIGNLIAGSYLVEIIQGDYTEKKQIIIQK